MNGRAVFAHKHALALAHASRGGKCKRRVPYPERSGGRAQRRSAQANRGPRRALFARWGGEARKIRVPLRARQGRRPSAGLATVPGAERWNCISGSCGVSPLGWVAEDAGTIGGYSEGRDSFPRRARALKLLKDDGPEMGSNLLPSGRYSQHRADSPVATVPIAQLAHGLKLDTSVDMGYPYVDKCNQILTLH